MKKRRKVAILAFLAALCIIPQIGCSKTADPVSANSFYFDTTCTVSVYDMEEMSEDNANDAIAEAFKTCRRYEKLLSKTKENSDIDRINKAKGKAVKCDEETIALLKLALTYCEKTDGKFDITIGKAVDLWDYHAENPVPPSEQKLKETMKYVDYTQIQIKGNTVTMGTDKGQIDLGAIAKGYIADKVCETLKEEGVTSAIVSLGGNISCVGDKGGTDFVIGIEKPYSDQQEIVGSTPLSDGSIVTSGTYERYFEYDGKRYHHILDSESGYPVGTDVVGVSIIGPEGHSVDCDALSTTCLILGKEEGMKLVESMDGYEALFILIDDSIETTDGFDFRKE